jgi:hypothetical protein
MKGNEAFNQALGHRPGRRNAPVRVKGAGRYLKKREKNE